MRTLIAVPMVFAAFARLAAAQFSAAEVGVAASAAAETPSSEQLVAKVAQTLPEHVGAAVLVRLDGETVFKQSYGARRLGAPGAVTRGTAFRLASASKIFTAAAVLRLVDDGKLSLDATLDEFFDDLPEYARDVTVEQLLNNTAGLPSYEQEMAVASAPTEGYRDDDVVAWLKTTDAPMFEPGESCRYCGTNYVMLALIVDRAADQDFGEFLEQAFFEPLEMNGAALLVEGEREPAERAFGHERFGVEQSFSPEQFKLMSESPRMQALREKDPDAANQLMWQVAKQAKGWRVRDQAAFSRLRGDGCVYASIDDLEKWFEALDSGEVLSTESMAKLLEPQATPDPDQGFQQDWVSKFTAGFLRDEAGGEPRLSHRGATQGFRQTIQWFPESDSLVVVLMNATGPWDLASWGDAIKATVSEARRTAE